MIGPTSHIIPFQGCDFWADPPSANRDRHDYRTGKMIMALIHALSEPAHEDTADEFRQWRIEMARRGLHVFGDGRDQFVETAVMPMRRWKTITASWKRVK
jgi:hypothetical protein